MALIRALPVTLAPAQEQERSSRYQLPSHFHSFCGALLLPGLTAARILPVRLPDFHDNIFSRTGYISNQLLHHSMFQHKYMQCSAAPILPGALLCNRDCRKNVFPWVLRCPPRGARADRADHAVQHASLASLHKLPRENKPDKNLRGGKPPDIPIICLATRGTACGWFLASSPVPLPVVLVLPKSAASLWPQEALLGRGTGKHDAFPITDEMLRRKWKFFLFPHTQQNQTQYYSRFGESNAVSCCLLWQELPAPHPAARRDLTPFAGTRR